MLDQAWTRFTFNI